MKTWIWPTARSLLASAVVFSLLLVYGRTRFYNDPGSVFFNSDYAFERRYCDYRQRQAEEFVKVETASTNSDSQRPGSLSTDISTTSKGGNNATICASFTTVRRRGTQYLDAAIGSALAGLSPQERLDVHFQVHFANSEPTIHPAFQQPWLDLLIDTAISYSTSVGARAKAHELEEAADWQAKSIFDYTYALSSCYDLGTPYVLMLEDDILLADSWLIRTLAALRSSEPTTGLAPHEWLYLRLFNQERSTGWSSRRIGANHEALISLGLILLILSLAIPLRRSYPTLRACLDKPTLAVVCLIAVPSLVVLFFQSGKASLLPPRPGLTIQNFGCCSQALLYPRDHVPGLLQYLRERERGQYDLMINDYAREQGLQRLSLYPVMVQHVGVESSLGTDRGEARSVWSAAFERLDAVRLEREHERMLEEVYGRTY
ncbi:MAG: hypothetical protein Q9165_003481 [Trypethelium subeluteriae]